jgi:5-dehydro-2-deoxygluconokinase
MGPSAEKLDLITVGRSSVDLYGEQIGGRLEDMGSFAKYVGGSPTNTAVGAARLGLNTGLVTRVGADHMGRFIAEELGWEGVDTRGVIADAERLTALVVLGIRDRDTFPLIFYRENCADMALDAADLDRGWIESAGAVLVNGTHLSTDRVFEASLTAARWCKEAGGRVVFDVDYRPVLWGLAERDMGENRFVAHEAVTARLQQVLPLCDLIVGTEEEIHILGGVTDTIPALRAIRAQSDALIVCKRGALGCSAFAGAIPDSLDDGVAGERFEIEVFNVLGAGDAFMAGFLRGWLRGEPVETCCTWGNACGAIVVSRHGCAPAMPTWPELQLFLSKSDRPYRLRDDTELESLHWATTRRRDYDNLTVLAIDLVASSKILPRSSASGSIACRASRNWRSPRSIGLLKAMTSSASCSTAATAPTRSRPPPTGPFGSAARSNCRAAARSISRAPDRSRRSFATGRSTRSSNASSSITPTTNPCCARCRKRRCGGCSRRRGGRATNS